MKFRLLAILLANAAIFVAASNASAALILSDGFESYANTAALTSVWTLAGTTGGTLDTALGNPGQSFKHSGTASVNQQSFAAVIPGPNEKLRYSADIYDDGLSANKRVTAGMRNLAGSNIIEMGMYNSPSHYAIRTVLFASGDSGYVAFSNIVDDLGMPTTNVPKVGWHRYTVDVTPSAALFKLDLNSDGIINATLNVPLTLQPAGFNNVRMGGPSGVSSAAGGANFDNIRVELVPEPASFFLIGLGTLGLAMFSHRRRT